MKPIIKNLTALCIGAFSLLLVVTTTASAQTHISVGVGFGYYPRFNAGYYYNPYSRYYGYAYPRIGLSFAYLPYGYVPFYYGANLYYQNNGVYYRQYPDHNYHVVAPPVGAEVPKLPNRAHPIMIDNQQYFELNSVYYKPNIKPDGTIDYLIAGKDGVLNTKVVPVPQSNVAPAPQPAPQVNQEPQVNEDEQQMPPPPGDTPAPKTGDVVAQLPNGCKAVTIAGKKYFVSSADVYYEEFNNDGKVGYRVQGTPEK
ncbi:DUF6515 family protein [Mucilaginibacter sp. AW1-3]